MVERIRVENYKGNVLDLPVKDGENSILPVTSITGLGPVAASINTTDYANKDGARFTSSKVGSRNITITMKLSTGTDSNGNGIQSIAETRGTVYKFFPVKRSVTITFITEMRAYSTVGIVESIEADYFGDMEGVQVSLICPDPLFYDNSTYEGSIKPSAYTYVPYKGEDSVYDYYQPVNIYGFISGTRYYTRKTIPCGFREVLADEIYDEDKKYYKLIGYSKINVNEFEDGGRYYVREYEYELVRDFSTITEESIRDKYYTIKSINDETGEDIDSGPFTNISDAEEAFREDKLYLKIEKYRPVYTYEEDAEYYIANYEPYVFGTEPYIPKVYFLMQESLECFSHSAESVEVSDKGSYRITYLHRDKNNVMKKLSVFTMSNVFITQPQLSFEVSNEIPTAPEYSQEDCDFTIQISKSDSNGAFDTPTMYETKNGIMVPVTANGLESRNPSISFHPETETYYVLEDDREIYIYELAESYVKGTQYYVKKDAEVENSLYSYELQGYHYVPEGDTFKISNNLGITPSENVWYPSSFIKADGLTAFDPSQNYYIKIDAGWHKVDTTNEYFDPNKEYYIPYGEDSYYDITEVVTENGFDPNESYYYYVEGTEYAPVKEYKKGTPYFKPDTYSLAGDINIKFNYVPVNIEEEIIKYEYREVKNDELNYTDDVWYYIENKNKETEEDEDYIESQIIPGRDDIVYYNRLIKEVKPIFDPLTTYYILKDDEYIEFVYDETNYEKNETFYVKEYEESFDLDDDVYLYTQEGGKYEKMIRFEDVSYVELDTSEIDDYQEDVVYYVKVDSHYQRVDKEEQPFDKNETYYALNGGIYKPEFEKVELDSNIVTESMNLFYKSNEDKYIETNNYDLNTLYVVDNVSAVEMNTEFESDKFYFYKLRDLYEEFTNADVKPIVKAIVNEQNLTVFDYMYSRWDEENSRYEYINIAMDGQEPKYEFCIYFNETSSKWETKYVTEEVNGVIYDELQATNSNAYENINAYFILTLDEEISIEYINPFVDTQYKVDGISDYYVATSFKRYENELYSEYGTRRFTYMPSGEYYSINYYDEDIEYYAIKENSYNLVDLSYDEWNPNITYYIYNNAYYRPSPTYIDGTQYYEALTFKYTKVGNDDLYVEDLKSYFIERSWYEETSNGYHLDPNPSLSKHPTYYIKNRSFTPILLTDEIISRFGKDDTGKIIVKDYDKTQDFDRTLKALIDDIEYLKTSGSSTYDIRIRSREALNIRVVIDEDNDLNGLSEDDVKKITDADEIVFSFAAYPEEYALKTKFDKTRTYYSEASCQNAYSNLTSFENNDGVFGYYTPYKKIKKINKDKDVFNSSITYYKDALGKVPYEGISKFDDDKTYYICTRYGSNIVYMETPSSYAKGPKKYVSVKFNSNSYKGIRFDKYTALERMSKPGLYSDNKCYSYYVPLKESIANDDYHLISSRKYNYAYSENEFYLGYYFRDSDNDNPSTLTKANLQKLAKSTKLAIKRTEATVNDVLDEYGRPTGEKSYTFNKDVNEIHAVNEKFFTDSKYNAYEYIKNYIKSKTGSESFDIYDTGKYFTESYVNAGYRRPDKNSIIWYPNSGFDEKILYYDSPWDDAKAYTTSQMEVGKQYWMGGCTEVTRYVRNYKLDVTDKYVGVKFDSVTLNRNKDKTISALQNSFFYNPYTESYQFNDISYASKRYSAGSNTFYIVMEQTSENKTTWGNDSYYIINNLNSYTGELLEDVKFKTGNYYYYTETKTTHILGYPVTKTTYYRIKYIAFAAYASYDSLNYYAAIPSSIYSNEFKNEVVRRPKSVYFKEITSMDEVEPDENFEKSKASFVFTSYDDFSKPGYPVYSRHGIFYEYNTGKKVYREKLVSGTKYWYGDHAYIYGGTYCAVNSPRYDCKVGGTGYVYFSTYLQLKQAFDDREKYPNLNIKIYKTCSDSEKTTLTRWKSIGWTKDGTRYPIGWDTDPENYPTEYLTWMPKYYSTEYEWAYKMKYPLYTKLKDPLSTQYIPKTIEDIDENVIFATPLASHFVTTKYVKKHKTLFEDLIGMTSFHSKFDRPDNVSNLYSTRKSDIGTTNIKFINDNKSLFNQIPYMFQKFGNAIYPIAMPSMHQTKLNSFAGSYYPNKYGNYDFKFMYVDLSDSSNDETLWKKVSGPGDNQSNYYFKPSDLQSKYGSKLITQYDNSKNYLSIYDPSVMQYSHSEYNPLRLRSSYDTLPNSVNDYANYIFNVTNDSDFIETTTKSLLNRGVIKSFIYENKNDLISRGIVDSDIKNCYSSSIRVYEASGDNGGQKYGFKSRYKIPNINADADHLVINKPYKNVYMSLSNLLFASGRGMFSCNEDDYKFMGPDLSFKCSIAHVLMFEPGSFKDLKVEFVTGNEYYYIDNPYDYELIKFYTYIQNSKPTFNEMVNRKVTFKLYSYRTLTNLLKYARIESAYSGNMSYSYKQPDYYIKTLDKVDLNTRITKSSSSEEWSRFYSKMMSGYDEVCKALGDKQNEFKIYFENEIKAFNNIKDDTSLSGKKEDVWGRYPTLYNYNTLYLDLDEQKIPDPGYIAGDLYGYIPQVYKDSYVSRYSDFVSKKQSIDIIKYGDETADINKQLYSFTVLPNGFQAGDANTIVYNRSYGLSDTYSSSEKDIKSFVYNIITTQFDYIPGNDPDPSVKYYITADCRDLINIEDMEEGTTYFYKYDNIDEANGMNCYTSPNLDASSIVSYPDDFVDGEIYYYGTGGDIYTYYDTTFSRYKLYSYSKLSELKGSIDNYLEVGSYCITEPDVNFLIGIKSGNKIYGLSLDDIWTGKYDNYELFEIGEAVNAGVFNTIECGQSLGNVTIDPEWTLADSINNVYFNKTKDYYAYENTVRYNLATKYVDGQIYYVPKNYSLLSDDSWDWVQDKPGIFIANQDLYYYKDASEYIMYDEALGPIKDNTKYYLRVFSNPFDDTILDNIDEMVYIDSCGSRLGIINNTSQELNARYILTLNSDISDAPLKLCFFTSETGKKYTKYFEINNAAVYSIIGRKLQNGDIIEIDTDEKTATLTRGNTKYNILGAVYKGLSYDLLDSDYYSTKVYSEWPKIEPGQYYLGVLDYDDVPCGIKCIAKVAYEGVI